MSAELVCGECRICCKVPRLHEIRLSGEEVFKEAGKWCPQSSAKGCGVYATRPQSCASYRCTWLAQLEAGQPLPPELRPDKCGVMIDVSLRDEVHVHQYRPGALRRSGAAQNLVVAIVRTILQRGYELAKVVVYDSPGVLGSTVRNIVFAQWMGDVVEKEAWDSFIASFPEAWRERELTDATSRVSE